MGLLSAETQFTFILSSAPFTSGQTHYFAAKACNIADVTENSPDGCSGYSPELGEVM